jgi:glycosyltransferase involved in cell wall biosynthesis
MRILMLLDDAVDVEGEVQLADEEGFVVASVRRDLVRLLPRLNRSRVQPIVYTLRGGEKTLDARRWLDPVALRRLLDIVRQQDVELIHALGRRALVYAALVGRVRGLPTLASVYELPSTDAHLLAQNVVQRSYMRLMRWGINRVVVPSEIFKREWLPLFHSPERVEVIYPGVEMDDSSQVAPDRAALGLPDGPLITMVAPMVQSQGHEIVLEAYQRLLQRVPVVNLAMLGTGPLRYNLFKQAAKIHPPNPITWLKDADLRAIVAASNVVVVHSRKDGLVHALVEAAALGKPVIATRMAGTMEIVDPSVTGFLTTVGDARDLSNQMSKVTLQPAFAEQLGRTARERALKRFSLDAQCEALTTLYESTIYATR